MLVYKINKRNVNSLFKAFLSFKMPFIFLYLIVVKCLIFLCLQTTIKIVLSTQLFKHTKAYV